MLLATQGDSPIVAISVVLFLLLYLVGPILWFKYGNLFMAIFFKRKDCLDEEDLCPATRKKRLEEIQRRWASQREQRWNDNWPNGWGP